MAIRRHLLFFIITLKILFVATAANATNFTVNSGETLTSPQTLNSGETGTVNAGGTFTTGASPMLIMKGNSTFINLGRTIMTGPGIAIYSDGTAGNLNLTTGGILQTPGGASDYAIYWDLGNGTGQITMNPGDIITGHIQVQSLGNTTVTINGGILNGNLLQTSGATGNSLLSINNTFSTNGDIINIKNININNNGTIFTVNNNIQGFTNFTINTGTKVFLSKPFAITGNTLVNNGLLELDAGVLTVPNFTNNGVLTIGGLGATISGPITGGGASSVLNVNAKFISGGAISNIGIINVNGGSFEVNFPVTGYTTFVNNATVNVNNVAAVLSGGMTAGASPTSTTNFKCDDKK